MAHISSTVMESNSRKINLRARIGEAAGIILLMFFMNNANQAWGSVSTGEDRNSVLGLNEVSNSSTDMSFMDSKCFNFQISPVQPVYNNHSTTKKCCSLGEIFEETDNGHFRCIPGIQKMDIKTLFVVFYGDLECIDSKKHDLKFTFFPNDSCSGSKLTFMYSKEQNDQMFVIQNGSLLVISDGPSITVFDSYCVEVDSNGHLLAKACDVVEPIVVKATAALIYIGMVIASIALVITCWVYAFVPKLNDIFGYLLVGHAGTFLVAMILMTLTVCDDRCFDHGSEEEVRITAYIFLIPSVMAFLLMNLHNYAYAICYLPQGLELRMENKRCLYISLAVLFTITTTLLLQSWRHSPIFSILYCYYAVIVLVLFLSHRSLNKLMESVQFRRYAVSRGANTEAMTSNSHINEQRLQDIMCLNQLCQREAGFTLLCWITLNWLQQHTSGQEDFYRIAAAYAIIFQGLFIGAFFLAERKTWTIICNYWAAAGSRAPDVDEDSDAGEGLRIREN